MCTSRYIHIAYMIYLPKYKGTTVYHVPKYLYTLFCVRRDPVSVSQSLWVPSSSVVSVLAYVTSTTAVPTLAWLSPLKRTKFASSRKNVSRVYRKTSRGWLAPLLCWWSSSWSSLRPSLVMSRGTSACWSLMLLLHTWSTSPVGTVDYKVKKVQKLRHIWLGTMIGSKRINIH